MRMRAATCDSGSGPASTQMGEKGSPNQMISQPSKRGSWSMSSEVTWTFPIRQVKGSART
ncbi:hypothetical protein H8959_016045 [Pygathrix nigripes]